MTAEPASQLIDLIEQQAVELVQSIEVADSSRIQRAVESTQASARSLNGFLPKELKPPHGPFRKLQEHLQFVIVYLGKHDIGMARRNARSIPAVLIGLRVAVAKAHGPDVKGMVGSEVELPYGPHKKLFTDAIRAYQVELFRASIASAVCSMEYVLRQLYETSTAKSSKGLDFYNIIIELEKMENVQKTEAPLLQILRLFRNYSSHPSDFDPTQEQALMVLNFVFARLKTA
jgi:hypothetical protein